MGSDWVRDRFLHPLGESSAPWLEPSLTGSTERKTGRFTMSHQWKVRAAMDDFETKVSRMLGDPNSCLHRIGIRTPHIATYVLAYPIGFKPLAVGFYKVEVHTISMMEVINLRNPPCLSCWENKKKLRGMNHA